MFLADAQHCPPPLRVARAMLLCRFMTTRLTLYRPYLLSAAIHRKQWSHATQQGGALVAKCLEIARDGVDTIASDWFPNHMLCWNHAWHPFQISLVLILAAVSDTSGAESELCNEYITKSVDLLAQMEPFDTGATRAVDKFCSFCMTTFGIEKILSLLSILMHLALWFLTFTMRK